MLRVDVFTCALIHKDGARSSVANPIYISGNIENVTGTRKLPLIVKGIPEDVNGVVVQRGLASSVKRFRAWSCM